MNYSDMTASNTTSTLYGVIQITINETIDHHFMQQTLCYHIQPTAPWASPHTGMTTSQIKGMVKKYISPS